MIHYGINSTFSANQIFLETVALPKNIVLGCGAGYWGEWECKPVSDKGYGLWM